MVKGSVCVDVNELRNRGEVLEKVNELGFAPGGTVIKMNSRIEKYVSELKRDYEARGFHSDQINFWDAENQNTFQFEANPVSQRIWTPPTKLSENIILNVLVKMDDTLRSSAY